MPTITTTQEATLLQLQYVAASSGLRRTYLGGSQDASHEGKERGQWSTKNTIQPYLQRISSVARPDIEWHPSFKTYQDRVERLLKTTGSRPTSVPEGFPKKIEAPRVWSGSDFKDPEKFTVRLNEGDILEVNAALAFFKTLGGDNGPEQVSRQTFPLPTLSAKLVDISKTLQFGVGFAVISGLNPDEYSPLDNVLLYLGITSYIAETRGAQDYDGRMLVHIKDMGHTLPEFASLPSPYTGRAQPFHNDRGDIVAMYALEVAENGGESLLASSGKVYNEIAATRPDVIHVLADDQWIFDDFCTPVSWENRPLLYNFKTHGPGFCYSRRPLTGASFCPHMPGVPAMTEVQAEALDMVHFTASEHAMVIRLRRGDIQLFNNFALFHARNGFTDNRRSGRHLIRLWLKNEMLAWETPEHLLEASWELYGDSNFRSKGRWDIHPALLPKRVITKRMNCS